MTERWTTRLWWTVLLGALLGVMACGAQPPEATPSSPTASVSGARRGPQPGVRPGVVSEPTASDPFHEIFDEPAAAPAPAADPNAPIDEPAASRELEALRERLLFPRGLFFPLVLLLAWAVSRAIHRGTRFVLRLGLARTRVVSIAGALGSLLAWVLAFVAIAVRLLRAAPTLTLGVLTLIAVASMLIMRRQLENLAAGVALAVRSRVREGDRIAVGEHQGVVRRVGFTRVELHQADGSRLFLPNHAVSTEAMAIGPARYSVPLQVSLRRDRPWSAEEIHQARQLAALSPYRDPSSRVVVEVEGEAEPSLSVQVQVWSPRLIEAAEEHLRRQLDRHVAHRPGLTPDGDRRQSERRTHERRGL